MSEVLSICACRVTGPEPVRSSSSRGAQFVTSNCCSNGTWHGDKEGLSLAAQVYGQRAVITVV